MYVKHTPFVLVMHCTAPARICVLSLPDQKVWLPSGRSASHHLCVFLLAHVSLRRLVRLPRTVENLTPKAFRDREAGISSAQRSAKGLRCRSRVGHDLERFIGEHAGMQCVVQLELTRGAAGGQSRTGQQHGIKRRIV